MPLRRTGRRRASAVGAVAVAVATLTPMLCTARAVDAATTTLPSRAMQVHGAAARMLPLSAGTRTSPRVELPRLRRPHAAAMPVRAAGAAMRTVDVDRVSGSTSSTSTGVPRLSAPQASASSVPPVLQLQSLQGVTHDGELHQFHVGPTPPDTQIAVSPTQVVEAVNVVALVMDHGGGNATAFNLASIWSGLLPGIGSTRDLSDPRIEWDTASQRWFVSMVIYDDALLSGGNSASSAHSWVALAASQGTSPSLWNAYVIQSQAGQLLDQPGLGVSSDKVTSSSSNFDFTQQSVPFVGAQIFVANKAEMLSGAANLDVTASLADNNAFGYVPAVERSASSTEYVPFNNNGNPSQPQMLSVVAVTGVPTPATSATFARHDMVMCPTCGVTPVTATPPPVPQPGTAATVDSGDDRLGSAVWQNGALWTGGNTGIDIGMGPQSALYVAEVNTGGFDLGVLQELYSGSGTSFVYPGIDLDQNGTPFIAFSRGSSQHYMSGGAFAFPGGSVLMTAGVVDGGAGSYFYDCSSTCGGGPQRWGDYSGAAVDPSDPRQVWTAAEYAATAPGDTQNWGTVLDRMTISPPTITSISAHAARTTGGVSVTVTGTLFDPASSGAVFGGVFSRAVQWIDERHIVVPAPPHAPGTYGVAAADAYGSSGELPNAFSFSEPPARTGYWEVAADGGIFSFGTAQFQGSMGGTRLNQPIVGMAAASDGRGYWLVARDGGIFAFGSAQFHGSMGGTRLNQPIVGMAAAPDGLGYWLVASDGGVFAFGSAQFHGSMGGTWLNQPIVGMAPTATGQGYWLVASDGGIFAFGDAAFHGSMGGTRLNQPITGMVPLSWGGGYWLVASDGGIFAFGAPFRGSTGGTRLAQPVVAMDQSGDDGGYWLVGRDGGVFAFGSAQFHGSMGAVRLNQPVVGMAAQPA